MYLLENGEKLLLWVGSDVDEKIMSECFIRGKGAEARLHLRTGPGVEGTKAEILSKFVGQIVEERKAIGASLILEIVTANSKYSSLFTKLLSEDKIAGEDSYIDFLCWI